MFPLYDRQYNPGVTHLVERREALRLLLSAAAVSSLAACGPAAPAPQAPTQPPPKPATTPAAAQPKTGGTLTAGMIGDLGSIEGHQVTQATVNVTFQAYDRLIEYDDKLTPQPMLAESWDISSDLKQIKLNLRKGVQFHSG